MRPFGLRELKWVTFGVAVAGVAVLFATLYAQDPGTGLLDTLVRALVLVGAVFAFNEYAFGLVARRDALLALERERLFALYRISRSVALVPTWERNLGGSLEILRAVMNADLAIWVEPTADGAAACRAAAMAGGDVASLAGLSLRAEAAAPFWGALRRARLLVVEDAERAGSTETAALPLVGTHSLRAAAAASGGVDAPLGAVVVGWSAPRPLPHADREFLENVGNLLGVAAENRRLYQETQRVGALEERERIAREMHDGLAQALTYLKLKAEAALARSRPGGAPILESALRAIRKGAVDALGDVRQALLDLKAPVVDGGADLPSRLERQVRSWSQLNDIEAEVALPSDPVVLPEATEAQVLRVAQEALANVRKHAAAKRVAVRLLTDDPELVLSVVDDGRGFDVGARRRAGHYGLGNLHDRAAAMGGTLHIASHPGCGTEVVLRVPLGATSRESADQSLVGASVGVAP